MMSKFYIYVASIKSSNLQVCGSGKGVLIILHRSDHTYPWCTVDNKIHLKFTLTKAINLPLSSYLSFPLKDLH